MTKKSFYFEHDGNWLSVSLSEVHVNGLFIFASSSNVHFTADTGIYMLEWGLLVYEKCTPLKIESMCMISNKIDRYLQRYHGLTEVCYLKITGTFFYLNKVLKYSVKFKKSIKKGNEATVSLQISQLRTQPVILNTS